MKEIMQLSGGKDSAAICLRKLAEMKAGISKFDEAVFFDTGMEFSAVYKVIEELEKRCVEMGVKFTRLYPKTPFEEKMFNIEVKNATVQPAAVILGAAACAAGVQPKNYKRLNAIRAVQ